MKRVCINAKEGTSLAVVTCVAAFLMAFALAMVYTAGLTLSRTNRRLEQERIYQLARSFSEVLEQELEYYAYPPGKGPAAGSNAAGETVPADGKTFYQYVIKFLEGQYGEYDPDYPDETIFHFTAGETSEDVSAEDYGDIHVVMYKEAGEEEDEMSGSIHKDTSLDDINTKPIQRYVFTVEVTAELNGRTYTYQTKYRQMVKYEVRYMYGASKKAVVKVGNEWHYSDATGELITLWDEGEYIQYEYLPGETNIKECIFENIYRGEGGSTP